MKIKQTIFLIAVGVAAGILLAPHKGSKTRKKLRRRAAGLLGQLKEKVNDAGQAMAEW